MRGISTPKRDRFLIAQPYNLGDVVCCLPIAGAIKQAWPKAQVFFAARSYARALVEASVHVDGYLDSDLAHNGHQWLKELRADVFINPSRDKTLAACAKRSGIPARVGNLRRLSVVNYCNHFVYYGREGSGLHEAQLNLKELAALGIPADFSEAEIHALYGLTRLPPLSAAWRAQLDDRRFKLIFHVKSNGNSREWPLEYFHALAQLLPADRFRIFVTGVPGDGECIRQQCPQLLTLPHVTDVTGRMELGELIAFIAGTDGLLAASTGPLHIAAALGVHALGLYPPLKGKEPVRWGPQGARAESLCMATRCAPGPQSCSTRPTCGGPCPCMYRIQPSQVAGRLLDWQRLSPKALAA